MFQFSKEDPISIMSWLVSSQEICRKMVHVGLSYRPCACSKYCVGREKQFWWNVPLRISDRDRYNFDFNAVPIKQNGVKGWQEPSGYHSFLLIHVSCSLCRWVSEALRCTVLLTKAPQVELVVQLLFTCQRVIGGVRCERGGPWTKRSLSGTTWPKIPSYACL